MLAALTLPTDALGRTFMPHAPAVTLDLRPTASFEDRHVRDAYSVPLGTLEERLFELPPPGEWPLEIMGPREALDEANALLQPKGWTPKEIDTEADPGWADLRPTAVGLDGVLPSPYRPNSFLAAALEAIQDDVAGEDAAEQRETEGLALDLGCGSGRDAVHIASALAVSAPQWQTVGLDNHVAALERSRRLAARYEGTLGNQIEFVAEDLRKGGLERTLDARPTQPLRLVHGCRWLDVRLLARLPELLAPGGLVLWSTFLDPPDGSEPLAPPFRRSRRLSSGQMRMLLGEDSGMDVLYDGEGELLTRSRWCNAQFFCARKRRE